MAIKKTVVMIVLLLLVSIKAKPQYDFVAKQLVTFGQVDATRLNWEFENSREGGIFYSTILNGEFPLSYVYDGNCGKFEICGNVFGLEKYFENRIACDLDLGIPEVYKFYKFSFRNKKYIALECINSGSGLSASFIFIHLFQVDGDSVLYYPLWSRYGSIACLGDFNKDNVLDFLKIRNNEKQTGKDTFIASLMSLDSTDTSFKDLPQSKKWYFKKVYATNNEIEIKTIKPAYDGR